MSMKRKTTLLDLGHFVSVTEEMKQAAGGGTLTGEFQMSKEENEYVLGGGIGFP